MGLADKLKEDALDRAAQNKAVHVGGLSGRLRAASDTGLASKIRAPAQETLEAIQPSEQVSIQDSKQLAERLKFERTTKTDVPSQITIKDLPSWSTSTKKSGLFQWFVGRESIPVGADEALHEPPVEAPWRIIDRVDLVDGFGIIRILENDREEKFYQVLEPILSPKEVKARDFVQDALERSLNRSMPEGTIEDNQEFISEHVSQIAVKYRLGLDQTSVRKILYYMQRDFLGFGPIHLLMQDPDLEDVSCDGVDIPLFVFSRTHGSIPTNVIFDDERNLEAFVIRLAQKCDKALTLSSPLLDAALPDGSRLQATLGREVTAGGSTFTIRRFRAEAFTPLNLLRFGTMDLNMAAWYWMIVENGMNFIVAGGTASGKTTALNAVSQFIPQTAKLVSIEDTREVNLPHVNWIRGVTRSASNLEKQGEIGMFELLKAALRQRPEYILVGEVRGIEAAVAFQAMATGHTVYSTMHADSARSAVYRLENDPINIPRLMLQSLDAVVIQAQVRVDGKRMRRQKEIVEIVGMDPETKELHTNKVFSWDPVTDKFTYSGRSYLLARIAEKNGWGPRESNKQFEARKKLLAYLLENDPESVEGFCSAVKAFTQDPAGFMEMLGK